MLDLSDASAVRKISRQSEHIAQADDELEKEQIAVSDDEVSARWWLPWRPQQCRRAKSDLNAVCGNILKSNFCVKEKCTWDMEIFLRRCGHLMIGQRLRIRLSKGCRKWTCHKHPICNR